MFSSLLLASTSIQNFHFYRLLSLLLNTSKRFQSFLLPLSPMKQSHRPTSYDPCPITFSPVTYSSRRMKRFECFLYTSFVSLLISRLTTRIYTVLYKVRLSTWNGIILSQWTPLHLPILDPVFHTYVYIQYIV